MGSYDRWHLWSNGYDGMLMLCNGRYGNDGGLCSMRLGMMGDGDGWAVGVDWGEGG